ncbi:MAG: 3-dehydroquinate synthase [Thermodesulfobacteriota bacterium]
MGQEIQVGLGRRSYPIVIQAGMLAAVGRDLAGRAIAKRYLVVADDQVARLHGASLLASLASGGLTADLLTFPAGEASKSLATVGQLASQLAQRGTDRRDGLIALGGGVTGDITGFLAAVYMRGIPFVQVPTTLLAQVDSSVGGKTGVDIPEGKNLVGAFYQPRAVYIDTRVLATLPAAELLNGLAEVVKYGVIRDAALFASLEEQQAAILARDLPVLERVIARCCQIKAEVVAADETEADLRRILNFGHTIGHAVEASSGYALAHGLAVAMGMAAAADIAVAKGMLASAERDRLERLLAGFGLPVRLPAGLDRQAVQGFLRTDKKAVAGRPFFVLPRAIGEVEITGAVDEALVAAVLAGRAG